MSRAAVSSIELERLTPSVAVAIALARVFGCTVEELFGAAPVAVLHCEWAVPPVAAPWRYWQAEVGGRRWLYPVESLAKSANNPHDGVGDAAGSPTVESPLAQRTLVIASCDPAAGLLATMFEQQSGYRLLVVPRSSEKALELLRLGRVHCAGVHLATREASDRNLAAARTKLTSGYRLLRVAVWQDGVAVAPGRSARSVRAIMNSRPRWIGREAGSGARQCMDELLPQRIKTKHFARDHAGVAEAIRSGWSDAGVCLRLASAEAGLQFLPLRDEFYELCYSRTIEDDPRMRALVRVLRSPEYQAQLGALPGYQTEDTGEICGEW